MLCERENSRSILSVALVKIYPTIDADDAMDAMEKFKDCRNPEDSANVTHRYTKELKKG
jgi:hypothetical protein